MSVRIHYRPIKAAADGALLGKIKQFIKKFYDTNYGTSADFSDMSKVPIIVDYDDHTNKIVSRVLLDLNKYQILYEENGKIKKAVKKFTSLPKMWKALQQMNFDDFQGISVFSSKTINASKRKYNNEVKNMRIYANKKRPVKASNDGRKWVNTELTQDGYAKFRNFLKKKGYKYETSGAGDMVHIEAYLNEAEIKEADNFLDTLDDVNGACDKKSVKASYRKRKPIMADIGAGVVNLDDMNTDVIPVVDFGTYGGPLSYALEDVFVADYLEVDNLDPENEDEAGALELINEGYDGTQDFFNQVLGLAPLYIQDAFDQYGIPAKVVLGTCEWNHPREYNYYDDTIEFNMTIDTDWVASKFAELSNEPKFADFLNDSFSSRSGFISYMPNEIEGYNDLLDPNSSDYWKVVSAIVKFMVYDDPSIRDDVTEDMIECLRGNPDYASLSSYGIY